LAGGGLADRLSSLAGKPLYLKDSFEKYSADVAVKSDLIKRELGYKPEYDLKRGWQETVEEWVKNGFIENRL
jgi:nucleoside-diphosphate-sugar epimerase